ncbi:MAG: universal stress protein [Myxococcaceae bacterium]
MKPFQKILVPTDFSRNSDDAVARAADMACRYGASVTLLHTFQPVAYPVLEGAVTFTPKQLTDAMTQSATELEREKASAVEAGVTNVETNVVQGLPGEEIVRFAKKGSFDLIVLGTHGRTGLTRVLMGSVAESVMRNAPCAVLLVRS